MSARASLALRALGGAIVLGALADALLRVTPWTVNLALWTAALAAVALLAAGRGDVPLRPGALFAFLPAVAAAAALAWRDSNTLYGLDFVALLAGLAWSFHYLRGGAVATATIEDCARAGLGSAGNAAMGAPILVLSDVPWGELARPERYAPARQVAIGVVLAVPAVAIFGSLLAGADPVFASVTREFIRVDFTTVMGHMLVAACWAWLVAGWLRGALLVRGEDAGAALPEGGRLGIVAVGTAVGTVALLFLLFVVIQVRYLFGGAAIVQQTTGLTYAEYARQGFFQLVWVTGLSVPLLLAADWLLDQHREADRRHFRLLAGLVLALLGVIVISALRRMSVYVAEFGYTELRTYATVFMLWLGLVLAWFGATVLRGRRERFAFGMLASGFVVLVLLSVANPDRRIAEANLARLAAGVPFDARYAGWELSADGAPALLAGLDELSCEDRAHVSKALLARWGKPRESDWRTWNRADAQARRLVKARREELNWAGCQRPAPASVN